MEAVANRHLDYRPDLDGLRAVAILPVLFFHADISWFPGGFVGVDVFFVLSGYFMARVIMADLDQDDFSFGRFYLRRIRRILPALFSMILATSVVAWFLFMPKEFEYFAESVRSAALFTSNLLFESESGYFDIAAEFQTAAAYLVTVAGRAILHRLSRGARACPQIRQKTFDRDFADHAFGIICRQQLGGISLPGKSLLFPSFPRLGASDRLGGRDTPASGTTALDYRNILAFWGSVAFWLPFSSIPVKRRFQASTRPSRAWQPLWSFMPAPRTELLRPF